MGFVKDKKIAGQIITLAFPVMMGELMFSILHFVDRFFIAKLGVAEAAGSSLSGTLVWMLITLNSIIAGGSIALVSRKIGEKNIKEASKSAEQSVFLAVFLGIAICAITFIFSGDIVGFYNAEPLVEQIGIEYFSVLVIGFPFLMTGIVSSVILQAAGNTKTPMIIFTAMSAFNIMLDPLLIFGWGPVPAFGVKGAAFATVASEVSASIAMLIMLYKNKGFVLSFAASFLPDFSMIKRILKIGLWSGLNSLSRPLSAIFLQKIMTFHGTCFVAAFSFGVQWISIVFILLEGMRVAIATLIGQALGKKDSAEAEGIAKAGLELGLVAMTVLIALGIPFAEPAIRMFSTDPAVVSAGSAYLIIVLGGMLFEIPMTVYAAAFNGAGDTMPPTVVAFGMYKREVIKKVGLFDENLIRNQDDEYNYRLLKNNFKIFLSKKLSCTYYVRASFRNLFRQYFQYGYWKVFVGRKHKALTSLRQLVPFFWVCFLFIGMVSTFLTNSFNFIFFCILSFYVILALQFAIRKSSDPLDVIRICYVFFILHFSYGLGYFMGVIDFLILNKERGQRYTKITR